MRPQIPGCKNVIAIFFIAALISSAARCADPLAASGDHSADIALDNLLDKAVAAEGRDDFKTALAIYSQATQTYPNEARAWAAYGEHLRFYIHDDAGAAAAFKKAIDAPQIDRHAQAFAWRGLGELAAKQGHDDDAIKMMEQSLQAMPLADTHRSLCHMMVMRKDWEGAARHARLAVELEPNDPIAILLYAAQLHRAGKQAEGRVQFQKALALAGVDAQGHAPGPVHCCVFYNSAGYYAVCGQRADALKMLEAFFKTPNHLHLSRAQIEQDSDFVALKDDKDFIAMLDQYVSTSDEKTRKEH